MRLKDRVGIVTGAAAGIGKEIAMTFAREGARVGVADLTLGQASEVVREIERAGGQALPVAMDVSDEAQVEAGVRRITAEYGGGGILGSNRGTQHIPAPAH